MISSAVVIPEQEPVHETNGTENGNSSSPTLKRKLSHSSPNDRKRPKVDTNSDTLNYDDTTKSASPEETRPRSAVQNSPPRRRPAPAVEEKKRNQRLFGSLLGTLSQSNAKSNPAHRKRDEIEARQRERLKREHEEQESARRRKKEDLAKKRQKEQRFWEEENQRLKHANMRAMAGFLRTKTEPVLYYLPWELRQDEEALIERQKDEAERLIQEELGNVIHEPLTAPVPDEANGHSSPDVTKEEQQAENGTATPIPLENGNSVPERSDDSNQKPEGDDPSPDTNEVGLETLHGKADAHEVYTQNDEHKDDDNHREELLEGQEDDVIY